MHFAQLVLIGVIPKSRGASRQDHDFVCAGSPIDTVISVRMVKPETGVSMDEIYRGHVRPTQMPKKIRKRVRVKGSDGDTEGDEEEEVLKRGVPEKKRKRRRKRTGQRRMKKTGQKRRVKRRKRRKKWQTYAADL